MKTLDEYKQILNITDIINGEINRMCVTTELSELDNMALHAKKNIEILQSIRYKYLKSNTLKKGGESK